MSRLERIYDDSAGIAGGRRLRLFGYGTLRLRRAAGERIRVRRLSSAKGGDGRSGANRDEGQTPSQDDDSVLLGGPVDPDYLLGPGDEIHLRTTGALEVNRLLVVDRNGTLFIPKIGEVSLLAVKASALRTVLQRAIQKQYREVEVEASLGRLHAIRIMLSGHLTEPGLRLLPANSTLLDALAAAGGILREGTLRRVTVQRRGKPALVVDLYPLLLGGDVRNNPVLLAGDVISVGPIGATVALLGGTREGIFELSGAMALREFVGMTGGTNSFVRLKNVVLERSHDHSRRELSLADLQAQAKPVPLRDGDVIALSMIPERADNTVSIFGAILRSGTFPHHAKMRISDLLRYGDGFQLDAALDRALLVRRLGTERAYDLAPGDRRGRVREEMIWVNLAGILAGEEGADLMLNRLDRLKILRREEVQDAPTVSILGAVRRPGTFRLTSGMRLGDLLALAGGSTARAYRGTSTIVRRRYAPGKQHFDVTLIPFSLQEVEGITGAARWSLQNHDQVVVRQVQALQVKVLIGGRVQFPGTYILPDGSRISDLLAVAGGLLDKADLRAGVFSRESIRTLQQRRLQDLFARSEEHFARRRSMVTRDGRVNEAVASHLDMLGLDRLSENMLRFQTQGRVVLRLNDKDFPESEDNLVLESGDRLMVPRRMNTVLVMGRVFYPNAFVWRDGMRVKDYLRKAGGIQEDADEDQVYLVMASGEVRSAAQRSRGRGLMSLRPGPGDTILVPSRPIGRSGHAAFSDTLALIRSLAEIGVVGATIPRINDKTTNLGTGLDLGTAPQPIPTSVGKP
ncbi:MAG: polysaccharide biosynthesis/export family protein, partial [Planctomycetota bacterium]